MISSRRKLLELAGAGLAAAALSVGLCCKNWLEREERLESSRYAANPNSRLITRFCARTSRLATPSIWPLRNICIAS
jgi:hypothetical protein